MMFWSIYCPVFAALVSAFVVTEVFHVGVGYYLHRKQEKLRAEFERKIASGEIDPLQMMFGAGGSPGIMEFPPGFPTTSGNEPNKPELMHGQYL